MRLAVAGLHPGSYRRERAAVRTGKRRQVADHEDLGVSRNRQVGVDEHAAGTINRRAVGCRIAAIRTDSR